MERLLGLSFCQGISMLVTDPLKFLRTVLTYWWLRVLNRHRRLNVYATNDRKDLTKLGVIIPAIEMEVEPPKENLDPHATDSVLIFGGNSSGAILLARVSRQTEGHLSWLHLKLPDGRSYQPPHPEKISAPGGDFSAGGLRIKCGTPMRKWRVSFNGLLRESKEDCDDSSRIVHAKFSFVCFSTSFAYDLSTDLQPALLAKYLGQGSGDCSRTSPGQYRQLLDRYIQPVCLLGTVAVDGEAEREVYLWGAKLRSQESGTCRWRKSPIELEFIGYTKEAQLIYSGQVQFPGFDSKLTFGHYVERTSLAWPVTSCTQSFTGSQRCFSGLKIDIKTERSQVTAEVSAPTTSLTFPSDLQVSSGQCTRAHLTPFRLHDGDTGQGILLQHNCTQPDTSACAIREQQKPSWLLPSIGSSLETPDQLLLLPLSDARCRKPGLSGGKGASLATLTYLAKNYSADFQVPCGFVITTAAYAQFAQTSGIENSLQAQLENRDWSHEMEKLGETCSRMVKVISKSPLPASVEDAIRRQLLQQFPETNSQGRFAVRSSASGEDSEELSAAGQMSTLLGVRGIDNILEAVVKCWASQFSLTAIQYKRQNGQELNSPMAVVVQEMVEADVAGVLFTCDPVTGNPQNITLTANYGLGESVVSASSDPDTLVLERNENNQVTPKSVQVGKKKTKVIMNDQGAVSEMHVDEKSAGQCCLSSDHSLLLLARVCLQVEEAYGFPVDVEWAFVDARLFLLQARPVTTVDRETKFELLHASDSGIRAENEYCTRANVGEVMPDAFSHFGLHYFHHFWLYLNDELYAHRNPYFAPFNPFQSSLQVVQNQAFINMTNFVLRFHKQGQDSFLTESNIISGFGRLLDDKEMFEHASRRNKGYPTTWVPYQMLFIVYNLIFGGRLLDRAFEKMWKEELDLSHCATSKAIFLQTWSRAVENIYEGSVHLDLTLNSSIYNTILMTILATANNGWGPAVYNDFAMFVKSCGDLESADIPRAMKELSAEIKKSIGVEKFQKMETGEALKWLETSVCSAGAKYQDFLRRHGHRCIKEFDVYSKPWRIDRLPLVQMLQGSIHLDNTKETKSMSVSEVMDSLKIPLNWKTKLFLKFLLPLSRRAVLCREKSKSLMTKYFDFVRQGFWAMAERMVKEGRLPDQDLMFFLTSHEVMQLIDTRSPALVQKAIRRRQLFPEQNKLRFPEITAGMPQPMNTSKRQEFEDLTTDLELRGTPVSQGVIKGIARVAVNLKEAAEIKSGEILIAYSTDVAWTPYFPLLGGVATELGGLISHGAVVAREYGLPCVVGVFDATLKFKTGDTVLLDGGKGILKRIQADS